MLRRYLFKRLLVAIPSLVIASLIVFTLPRLLPGDAVQSGRVLQFPKDRSLGAIYVGKRPMNRSYASAATAKLTGPIYL